MASSTAALVDSVEKSSCADGGSTERPVDRLVGPDQRFLEIDLVVSTELRSGLPVLVVEPLP